MEITRISLTSEKIIAPITLALVSDMHNRNAKPVLDELENAAPDMIMMPGDIFDEQPLPEEMEQSESLFFLRECTKIAPAWFSIGNHEKFAEENLEAILKSSGVTLLDDAFEKISFKGNDIIIGGLTSPCGRARRYSRLYTPDPDVEFLDRFADTKGYKILLSHHPEFYPRVIASRPIELILSGHAHGGQIRFGDQGLFAPGQRFFPKYTSGLYDNRLVVSRGLGNQHLIPRLWNKFQLIFVTISPKT
ncbi:MAG: metallophosphoesterase [Clostridia bacterium]|nr:metallophosphoesterase [Clostridia bacterium]